jgi:hypothetical protein
MISRRAWIPGAVAAVVLAGALLAQVQKEGFTDTPVLPGQKWRVHDPDRPAPRVVTPARKIGDPPSDAIVLFNGRDLSNWEHYPPGEPTVWKVRKGYMESSPRTGDLMTRDKFGDFQLHLEWSFPKVEGKSQTRGNSGVFIHSRYEVQILDSYDNPTYVDGQSSAIYGQWPPLVNASRKASEWQSYDIVFHAPKFKDGELVAPATVTVFHNGVLTHEKKEFLGPTLHRKVATESPYDGTGPIRLQDHATMVRFRNVWLRPLKSYDEP